MSAQLTGLGSRVSEVWQRAERSFQPDASLPQVVLENRRRRALARFEAAIASRGSDEFPPAEDAKLANLLRQWAARGYEDAFDLMQEFEIRCARDRDLILAEGSGDQTRVLDVLERDYRQWLIEQFGQIELRGVQVSHRVRLDLLEVYVPLHLEPVEAEGRREKNIIELLASRRIPVDEVLREQRRITIGALRGAGSQSWCSI